MLRMEMNCDMHFWKSIGMSVFQRFMFGLKIVEILQTFCCSADFLQEIVFNHLVRVSYLSSCKFLSHNLYKKKKKKILSSVEQCI